MLGMIGTAWGFMKSKVEMILAIVALVLLAMWRIFAAGKQSQKAEQQEKRLEDISRARKVEDGIRKKPPDQQRQELRDKWSR